MMHSMFGTPPEAYFATRYAVLRQPLGMPVGSERLPDDAKAHHAWVEHQGEVIGVGRAHIIPSNADGSGKDHDGPNAAIIPPFGPLATGLASRPAFQIRQMGTVSGHRRTGIAGRILEALEREMVHVHGAKTGFLQAREPAVPFYESQGWVVIDEPYGIAEIGPHRSMMKTF